MLNEGRGTLDEGRGILNEGRGALNEGRGILNEGSGNPKRAPGTLFGAFWCTNLIFLRSASKLISWNFPPKRKRKTRHLTQPARKICNQLR